MGLVTGQNPDTPTAGGSFGRGDFAIDFARDGSFEFGVLTKNRSATVLQGDVVSTFGSYWLGDSPSKAFDVQWTMDCANDIITLDPPGLAPEPASAALVLLGAGLMAGQRRRVFKPILS